MQPTPNHLTGIYRSNDPIDNLRIKLTLLKLNTLTQVFGSKNNAADVIPADSGASTTTVQQPTLAGHQQHIESYIFAWQQKQLGRHELRRFADAKNCHTDLHKKYNRIATGDAGDGRPPHTDNKVFTYVHEDDHHHQQVSPINGDGSQRDDDNDDEQHDDALFKWKDLQAAVRTLNADVFTMHIMAHLGADDSDDAETELFVLKWCPRTSVLSVYPDFNDPISSPYLHEINASSRHWYQYALENVSASSLAVDDGESVIISNKDYAVRNVRNSYST